MQLHDVLRPSSTSTTNVLYETVYHIHLNFGRKFQPASFSGLRSIITKTFSCNCQIIQWTRQDEKGVRSNINNSRLAVTQTHPNLDRAAMNKLEKIINANYYHPQIKKPTPYLKRSQFIKVHRGYERGTMRNEWLMKKK
jgi:hypothetical protein